MIQCPERRASGQNPLATALGPSKVPATAPTTTTVPAPDLAPTPAFPTAAPAIAPASDLAPAIATDPAQYRPHPRLSTRPFVNLQILMQ